MTNHRRRRGHRFPPPGGRLGRVFPLLKRHCAVRNRNRRSQRGLHECRWRAMRLALAMCLAGAGQGIAQEGRADDPGRDRAEVAPGGADTAAALARAREAQAAFERLRRRHFERGFWLGSDCDEHVGRFCLDHEGDDDWARPPDPPEVQARLRWLLSTLDTVARVVPHDPWTLGQRVKYRVEAGEGAAALDLLDACQVEAWWCEALRGFVNQHDGRYAAAEAAYDRALARLPPNERCAWTDLSPALHPDDRGHYEKLACGTVARRRFERAFWHLSDPLWLLPGREGRAEHLTRRVWALLQADAASGYGLSWGPDIEELTMRYGWPDGWDVAWRRDPGLRTERSIQAHRPAHSQRFAVSGLSGGAPDGLAWELEDARPWSTWALPSGPVHPLPHQLGTFRRGEARLVVAAFRAPEALAGCAVRSGLFLGGSFGELARREGEGTLPLAIVEPAPPGSATIVGVETVCADGSGVARARAQLHATDKWLSDLLLLDPAGALPGTLDAALARARPHSTARAGETLVVYWEWYGPPEPAAALGVTVTLTREDRGFWRKALQWTGLAGGDREEVGIRWLEPVEGAGPGRALGLELPDLAPGQYRLTLQVQSARVGTIASARELVIAP